MDEATLAAEAQALTTQLHQAWSNSPCDSSYAARIVALSERAQRRSIRRAARCGDTRAQRWLELLEKVANI
jgi:hypothetical protein